MPLCHECQSQPIARGNRRYCAECSRRASARWKARNRRQSAERWRAEGRQGQPPWLDGWSSLDARRAYYRAYMAAWRRSRARQASSSREVTSADGSSLRTE